VDFHFAAPGFDFFFAGDGYVDVGEVLEMDQAEDFIACCEVRD
jgi:hypothetical protein